MLNGCLAAIVLLKFSDGWVADKATHTQFMLDIGMAWAVTTLSILSVGRQLVFLLVFAAFGWGFRRLLPRLSPSDRWNAALIWLIACALGADWCGLHFMVGAFLAGRILGWDKGESRLIG